MENEIPPHRKKGGTKKPYSIEWKVIVPIPALPKWSDWSRYRRYETLERAKQALKSLSKNRVFEYRLKQKGAGT